MFLKCLHRGVSYSTEIELVQLNRECKGVSYSTKSELVQLHRETVIVQVTYIL